MRKRSAFTLIEIIIVISLIGTVLFCAAFPLRRFQTAIYLEATSKRLISELRKTQSQAICRHTTIAFNPSKLRLPQGILLSQAKVIAFAPSGFPAFGKAGSLILQNSFGQTRKIVVSSLGRIRLE